MNLFSALPAEISHRTDYILSYREKLNPEVCLSTGTLGGFRCKVKTLIELPQVSAPINFQTAHLTDDFVTEYMNLLRKNGLPVDPEHILGCDDHHKLV